MTSIRSLLLLVSVMLCASTANAEIIIFSMSGTFTDGAVLGGTMTIDNVAGTVTQSNLTVGAPDAGIFNIIGYSNIVPDSEAPNLFWEVQTYVNLGVPPG